MFTRLIRLAFAALAFFIAGMAAADTNIPIDNPNFSGTPSPSGTARFPDLPAWTQNGYFNGIVNIPIFGMQDINKTDNSNGIYTFLTMACGMFCPTDQSNSVSQVINGLVLRHVNNET